ncbi:universal stress protein UspA [Mycolicibacterium conceptionense]|jgi:nucleotide-binding universal stress UspA family protein|uniref:Universal stress protein UspA n=2 Tax=Mycolicibacterium TaxID=1866885 RepID=A0A0J8U1Q8_9MYCO|nr:MULTISPECIES: universal stress protein [Mycolicibacterium]KLI09790.1 universal stress protein UspA [Mycolicibacterium senegalense]KLO54661.1 universal stress protein UspA [Mycolicibacterium senegalense]KMV14435.1 universal stress protein UspA [Mycolicibacterium conceptionense]MCW1820041.1 universal stress protein [Mycolicibacterium senegalense]OBB06713.1 universal stress protein UspA [Mycolicibacterium conceptionense]
MTRTNLVVGYLATPGGADALALAVRFARTLDAEINICIVLPPDTAPPGTVPKGGGYEDVVAGQAQRWLDDARALVPDDVVAHTHLSFDESFTDGLIREALRLHTSAIVVGGAGGGLAGSFSLGSVVNELLHSAPLPVAVAPRGTRFSKVQRVHEITCAIGQRQGSDLLLDTAVRASRAAGVPLRLVSLVALDPAFGSLRGDAEAVRGRALAHAERTLDAARDELPADFPVTSTIVNGPTVEAAVEQLAWDDGDIIMVGSSRLSAPRRIFLGSTAAKMLRVLDVPMVVVPRDELKDGEDKS